MIHLFSNSEYQAGNSSQVPTLFSTDDIQGCPWRIPDNDKKHGFRAC